MKKKRIDSYLDPEVNEQLNELSKETGLPKSRLIELAVRKLIEERKKDDVL